MWQMFQMDLGFIRRPGNFEAVIDRSERAKPKLIPSRQGFTCYLLIIDRKSRYLWVFPLKTNTIPPELFTQFFKTNGLPYATRNLLGRTDGNGALAESKQFRLAMQQRGYTVQKTATDSSAQNGIVEQPHQTLATMVRCMLYASALPAPFWADVVAYAAYIKNRLYHHGTEAIPYTTWTGKIAEVRHIRMFGARVYAKSGHRPTKLDPHFYDGRLLRFSATNKNIIYSDTNTQREKTARHCTLDEFHFDTAKPRPPGAQQLVDTTMPNWDDTFIHQLD